jgi:glucuronoarabinoxylan endo-1,4-beta-xylanase
VWDHSDHGLVELSKQAVNRGVNTVYGNFWTAPGFMKTNGTWNYGGTICGTPGSTPCPSGDWRYAYADYIIKYIQLYGSEGVNLTHIGFTNEPILSRPYGSMQMTPAQLTDMVKVLGLRLAQSLLSTKIACCDTNTWKDGDSIAPITAAIDADSTARAYLKVATGHAYWGLSAFSDTLIPAANTYGQRVWQTEVSNDQSTSFHTAWDDGANTNTSGLTWAENIHNGLTLGNNNAWMWWLAAGYVNNDEALIRTEGTSYMISSRLWALAGYSRYIRPGSTRVDANSTNGNLKVSAYKNTDGTSVIVAINKGNVAESTTFNLSNMAGSAAWPYLVNNSNSMTQQSAIAISGGNFTSSIPARSMVTYRITGSNTDNLNNWSLTYSHSANWTIDTANSANFDGDTSRATRTATSSQTIVWNKTSSTAFSAKIYYYGPDGISNMIKMYTSPDNITWTPLSIAYDAPTVTAGSWYRTTFTPGAAIPAGTNYIGLEFTGGANAWSPQLSQMIIN